MYMGIYTSVKNASLHKSAKMAIPGHTSLVCPLNFPLHGLRGEGPHVGAC